MKFKVVHQEIGKFSYVWYVLSQKVKYGYQNHFIS